MRSARSLLQRAAARARASGPRGLATSHPPFPKTHVEFLRQREAMYYAAATYIAQNRVKLLAGGGLLGAGAVLGGGFLYFQGNPNKAESIVASWAMSRFVNSTTFEIKKAILMRLPAPDLSWEAMEGQLQQRLAAVGRGGAAREQQTMPAVWAAAVQDAKAATEGGFLSARREMRRNLVEEAVATALDLPTKLSLLRELIPPSVERDLRVSEELEKELAATGWLDGALLEANPPQLRPTTHSAATRVLQFAIGTFPGPMHRLIAVLDGDLPPAALAQELQLPDPHHRRQVEAALGSVAASFRGLGERERAHVLQAAVQYAITLLPRLAALSPPGAPTPRQLYERAVDRQLLGPLRRDRRISEDILQQVKSVYLALPPSIQSRVLLTAIRHPTAKALAASHPDAAAAAAAPHAADADVAGAASPETAEMVRDLLSAGGVVAVKLAQMIAEDPKVSREYRELLGALRDANEPVGPSFFWHYLPTSIRSEIAALGPCLGTGSVKQVHRAKVRAAPFSQRARGGEEQLQEVAVAILRNQVEDEALSSLEALRCSPDLEAVAKRLSRLVYGEFNLFAEGEALDQFALTSIGKHPRFRVVQVKHHSPKCLMEEIAEGPTVAAALAAAGEGSERRASILALLHEYHLAVFNAFARDGLIHSDIHLGNAVLETAEDGSLRFALFDVGQFERINPADTLALLWLLSWMSSPDKYEKFRRNATRHLIRVSSFPPPGAPAAAPSGSAPDAAAAPPTADAAAPEARRGGGGGGGGAAVAPRSPAQLISEAFDEATAPQADGTLPDKKTVYMLFLRNAEQRGVLLPQGAFALAKMLDGIMSQQESFDLVASGLFDVVDVRTKEVMVRSLSATDVYDLAASYSGSYVGLYGSKKGPPVPAPPKLPDTQK